MPNQILETGEIIEELTQQLEAAGYDLDSPGTFTGALVVPLLDALGDVNTNVLRSYNRNVLGLANDIDLEEKAIEFATSKNEPGQLSDETGENFNVYLNANTAKFYTIDQTSPLVIPASAITISSTDGTYWTSLTDISFEPDAFSSYVPIISNTVVSATVEPGAISSCTIDYTQIINLDLTKSDQLVFGCKNNAALDPIESVTTDADVRAVAYAKIGAMNNTNREAIGLVLAKYGISNIDFKQDAFGSGTLGILARAGNSSRFSEVTIKKLNNILTNISPGSRILEPDLLVVRFVFDVTYNDPVDKDNTKAQILTNLNDYFNLLDLGKSISPQDIIDTMLTINNVRTFDIKCIFVDDRKVITTRQNALSDQLFVLDGDAPISYLI